MLSLIHIYRTLYDLSTKESFFNHNIAVTTAPNGDLIAIGDDTTGSSKLTMRRSKDGGRTWGEATLVLDNGRMADGGGFLVDNGTIWYIFHHNNGTTLKLSLIHIYGWQRYQSVVPDPTGHGA